MPDGIVRIGDRATFQAFRASRLRARSGAVSATFVPAAPGDDRIRVAYAIGRRTGSAVVRNRLRRRLRVVMRTLASEGHLARGAYLVSGTPGADRLSFDELSDAVADVARRLGGVPR